MASETGISNRALQRVGATRITSIDAADNKSARECKVAYEPVRDALLRRYPWSFAIARVQLAAGSTAPAFGPARSFPWPADAVSILLPNDYDLDWVVEGRAILSDWAAPLDLRYITLVTDPNLMDALFREALAINLAHEICEAVTGSNIKQAGLRQAFIDIVAEARRVGAMEKMPDFAPESDWIAVRG